MLRVKVAAVFATYFIALKMATLRNIGIEFVKLAITALCFSVGALSASAWGGEVGPRYRVALEVNATDSSLKDRVTSYINKELRALGDVDVSDTKPTYKITVIVLPSKLRAGQTIGYSLAYLVTQPIEGWADHVSGIDTDARGHLAQILDNAVKIEDLQLQTGSNDDLRQTVSEMISHFDTESIEPMRKLQRWLKDSNK